MSFYDFSAKLSDGSDVTMAQYKGQVVLVVNTATKCGLAPQFDDLEALHQKYAEEGLCVLGFPSNQFANQEPGDNDQVAKVCRLDFGVTFTLFEKIDVNGENAHPIYQYLKKEAKGTLGDAIKWNFTKFLIDRNGKIVKRYAPTVNPRDIEKDILKLLKA